jgi:hypothetical protein
MPKKTSGKSSGSGGGVPKKVIADLNSLKTRLGKLEKDMKGMGKQWQSGSKEWGARMKKYETQMASMGKRGGREKTKRKPSPYNLFLKDKMSQGMSMVDAVKAWKEQGGSASSGSSSSMSSSYSSPSSESYRSGSSSSSRMEEEEEEESS